MIFFKFKGILIDAATGKPIKNGKILVKTNNNELIKIFYSNKKGFWKINNYTNNFQVIFFANSYCKKIIDKKNLKLFQENKIKLLSHDPVGYIGQTEILPGGKLKLRVHSKFNWTYTLYKHGQIKKKIFGGKGEAIIQKVPDSNFVENGLNWKVSKMINIPNKIKSGLYSINIKNKFNKNFYIPFSIGPNKNKESNNKFLIICNTNTWKTYNCWGGRSRYRNFEQYPENGYKKTKIIYLFSEKLIYLKIKKKIINFFLRIIKKDKKSGINFDADWTTKKLSVNRPITNIGLGERFVTNYYLDHLAAHEWRALAWFEREGFEYDYYSDFYFNFNLPSLKNYKAIILIGHPEYWTQKMIKNLKNLIYKFKTPLINLGGNSIYQEVYLDKNGNINAKKNSYDRILENPLSVKFSYTDLNITGFAPYKIEKNAVNHWVLKSFNKKKNKSLKFGKKSLLKLSKKLNKLYNPHAPNVKLRNFGKGASGWEIEKVNKTVSKKIVVLAKGLNNNGGAEMFIVENKKIKLYFSVSSISFISSLLVDDKSSLIIKNICKHLLK